MTEQVRYYSAEKMTKDDFGEPITGQVGEVIYDAKTNQGPWATMTSLSWMQHSRKIGHGLGQKYVRNEEGHLVKVDG